MSDSPLVFKNGNDPELWWRNLPREVAAVIAPRAALRVAPLMKGLAFGRSVNIESPSVLLLPLLRCLAVQWAVARYHAHGVRTASVSSASHSAASLVSATIDTVAGEVAVEAYIAASSAATAVAIAYAAPVPAAVAACGATAHFDNRVTAAGWEAITVDVGALDKVGPEALAGTRLWPNGTPPLISEALVDLSNQLLSRRDEGWQHWLKWLNDRFSDDPVRLAGDEEKEIARLTLPEEMWAEGARTIAGVKAVNAEIARRLAEIDARREKEARERAAPPLPPLGPGQKFRFGEDGLAFEAAEGPLAGFDHSTQSAIYDELQLAVADLLAVSRAKSNEHPALCNAVERYAALVVGPLDHADPKRLMTIGTGLTARATAFGQRGPAPVMDERLEPSHLAELLRVDQLHRALLFGFRELRPVLEGSDRLRRADPAVIESAAGALGRLLSGLAGARGWVAETTRQGLAVADDAYARFGWRVWEAGFNAYELVRNGLITTTEAIADAHGLLSTVTGSVVVSTVDPGFAATLAHVHAASTFLAAHAQEISCLTASFPDMKAWFDWILGRLRTVR